MEEYFPEYIFPREIFQICLLISLSIPLAASRAIIMFTLCAIIGNLIFSREAAAKHFRKLGKILISCWSYIRIRVDQHHTNIMSFFLSLCCTGPIIQIMFIVIPDIFIVTKHSYSSSLLFSSVIISFGLSHNSLYVTPWVGFQTGPHTSREWGRIFFLAYYQDIHICQ